MGRICVVVTSCNWLLHTVPLLNRYVLNDMQMIFMTSVGFPLVVIILYTLPSMVHAIILYPVHLMCVFTQLRGNSNCTPQSLLQHFSVCLCISTMQHEHLSRLSFIH